VSTSPQSTSAVGRSGAGNPPLVSYAQWSSQHRDVFGATNFDLVANPLNRYSIGDRTPGLHTDADGSVTIYLQAAAPGPGKEASWLPTPAGAFRPVMRRYQPPQPVLTAPCQALRRGGLVCGRGN
jgi:hypothetical protein